MGTLYQLVKGVGFCNLATGECGGCQARGISGQATVISLTHRTESQAGHQGLSCHGGTEGREWALASELLEFKSQFLHLGE